MNYLNDRQIQYIEFCLAEARLRHGGLQEELLDHLCCAVEEKMADGCTFQQAVKATFDTFRKDEMQEIQAQIFSIHTKKRLMMKVSLLVLASLLTFSGLLWDRSPEDPPLDVSAVVASPVFHFDPPSTLPVKGRFSISSGYGMRMHPVLKKKRRHLGIDVKAPMGTNVLATSDGIVEEAGNDDQYGNYILLRHDSVYQTKYAHLSEIKVKEGQRVSRGMIIGTVGNTGKSTAPHLHYEVIKDGKHEDPEKYIARRE